MATDARYADGSAAGKLGKPHHLGGPAQVEGLQAGTLRLPGYIPEGLTIFAGKPKAGKSWLLYDVCVACELKEALAEATLENRLLKKSVLADGEDIA